MMALCNRFSTNKLYQCVFCDQAWFHIYLTPMVVVMWMPKGVVKTTQTALGPGYFAPRCHGNKFYLKNTRHHFLLIFIMHPSNNICLHKQEYICHIEIVWILFPWQQYKIKNRKSTTINKHNNWILYNGNKTYNCHTWNSWIVTVVVVIFVISQGFFRYARGARGLFWWVWSVWSKLQSKAYIKAIPSAITTQTLLQQQKCHQMGLG